MIQDLDATLATMLHASSAPARLAAADVSFDTPEKGFAPKLSDSVVNLFLYEVRENRELRTVEPWVSESNGRSVTRRPPVRVECAYLVTAWSKKPARVSTEHELLGLAFAYLSRFDVIPSGLLLGSLAGQPYPPPALLAQWDGARSAGEFWSALGVSPRPSFNLTVTIAFDLALEVTAPLVTTTLTGYQPGLTTDGGDLRIAIGGTVRDPAGAAVPDAWVRIDPLGATTVTDALGRFTFPSLQAGVAYTIRARAVGLGEATLASLDLSSPTATYDVQF